MPITGKGWELHVDRRSEQARASDGKRRTVGKYQVYHDGVKQTGAGLSGTIAETRGPGANKPKENGRRIEAGTYQLSTQGGKRYFTFGFDDSEAANAKKKPGLLVKDTGVRDGIVIHPGQGYLSSIGCFNPCTSLPNAAEPIDYVGSRKRVIQLIENVKAFTGAAFPKQNGKRIPNASIVVDGEPTP